MQNKFKNNEIELDSEKALVFKESLLEQNYSGRVGFFQSPFTKIILRVKTQGDILEVFCQHSVLFGERLSPVIKIEFFKNKTKVKITFREEIPRNVIIIYLLSMSVIFFQMVFMDMTEVAVPFLSIITVGYFCNYYYFSLKVRNKIYNILNTCFLNL
jgi:hypothetical protein